VLDKGPDGQPAHTEESMIRAEAGFARWQGVEQQQQSCA